MLSISQVLIRLSLLLQLSYPNYSSLNKKHKGGLAPMDWMAAVKELFKTTHEIPSLETVYRLILGLPDVDLHKGLLLQLPELVREEDEEEGKEKKKDGSGKGDDKDAAHAPIHVLRAMIAQGIKYRSNKKARDAIEAGSWEDTVHIYIYTPIPPPPKETCKVTGQFFLTPIS